jgi:hypothetical protein
MCEYSVNAVATRPAVVGEDLPYSENAFRDPANYKCAVCLPVGTELRLSRNVRVTAYTFMKDGTYAGIHRPVEGNVAKMNSFDFNGHRRDTLQFPGMDENEIVFFKELAVDGNGPLSGTILQLPVQAIAIKRTPWVESSLNVEAPALAAYRPKSSETPTMRAAHQRRIAVLTFTLCIATVIGTLALMA